MRVICPDVSHVPSNPCAASSIPTSTHFLSHRSAQRFETGEHVLLLKYSILSHSSMKPRTSIPKPPHHLRVPGSRFRPAAHQSHPYTAIVELALNELLDENTG